MKFKNKIKKNVFSDFKMSFTHLVTIFIQVVNILPQKLNLPFTLFMGMTLLMASLNYEEASQVSDRRGDLQAKSL